MVTNLWEEGEPGGEDVCCGELHQEVVHPGELLAKEGFCLLLQELQQNPQIHQNHQIQQIHHYCQTHYKVFSNRFTRLNRITRSTRSTRIT